MDGIKIDEENTGMDWRIKSYEGTEEDGESYSMSSCEGWPQEDMCVQELLQFE